MNDGTVPLIKPVISAWTKDVVRASID